MFLKYKEKIRKILIILSYKKIILDEKHNPIDIIHQDFLIIISTVIMCYDV
jgi:hypothetical protein